MRRDEIEKTEKAIKLRRCEKLLLWKFRGKLLMWS